MRRSEHRSLVAIHAAVLAGLIVAAASGQVLAPTVAGSRWPAVAVAVANATVTTVALGVLLHRLLNQTRRRWIDEHDALTRLVNHDRMTLEVARAWQRAQRDDRALAVVVIDADGLAAINAAFGRAVGNRVLAEIGEACRRVARPGDLWSRGQGDRFVGLLPDSGPRQARLLAEQVRAGLARMTVATREGVDVHATVSAGIAADTADHRFASTDDLVAAAERALQSAKQAGRDRVVVARRRRACPLPTPPAVAA